MKRGDIRRSLSGNRNVKRRGTFQILNKVQEPGDFLLGPISANEPQAICLTKCEFTVRDCVDYVLTEIRTTSSGCGPAHMHLRAQYARTGMKRVHSMGSTRTSENDNGGAEFEPASIVLQNSPGPSPWTDSCDPKGSAAGISRRVSRFAAVGRKDLLDIAPALFTAHRNIGRQHEFLCRGPRVRPVEKAFEVAGLRAIIQRSQMMSNDWRQLWACMSKVLVFRYDHWTQCGITLLSMCGKGRNNVFQLLKVAPGSAKVALRKSANTCWPIDLDQRRGPRGEMTLSAVGGPRANGAADELVASGDRCSAPTGVCRSEPIKSLCGPAMNG